MYSFLIIDYYYHSFLLALTKKKKRNKKNLYATGEPKQRYSDVMAMMRTKWQEEKILYTLLEELLLDYTDGLPVRIRCPMAWIYFETVVI